MKILTATTQGANRDDDFCGAVEGEIVIAPFVCDKPGCGCDRSFTGLNSGAATTTVMVRRVDLTEDELVEAAVGFLEQAGWAKRITFELDPEDGPDPVRSMARDLIQDSAYTAAAYEEGSILRPVFDRNKELWGFRATRQLPNDVDQIIEHLATWAKGYGNRLKWNEEAKFKSDLMMSKARWTADRVPPAAFRQSCLDHGMTPADASLLTDYLKRAQAGKRLVPQRSYRGFKFAPDPED